MSAEHMGLGNRRQYIHPNHEANLSGKHRSLFIGNNYSGSAHALHGCHNDVINLRTLVEDLGFDSSEACILVDDEDFEGRYADPIKEEIVKAFEWLVQDTVAGDNLIFHYSGHGVRPKIGDELHDALVPSDFQTSGFIFDKDIFEDLCRKVPPGVRLTAIVDACHSASVFSLPFNLYPQSTGRDFQQLHVDNVPGDIFLISGCKDDQTSADVSEVASFFHGNGHHGAGGVCTTALLQILEQGEGHKTYEQVLEEMDAIVKAKGYTQIPQMSSSQAFNASEPFSFFGPLPL